MKPVFSLVVTLSLLLSALLSACTSAAPAAPSLDGSNWQLLEMNGQKLPLVILITLSFSEGQAGGQAPCNGYGAAYTQDGSQLSLEPGVSTMMYCEGVMEYETDFTAAFSAVKSFTLENDRLSLLDQSGAVLLVFGPPQPAPALEGSAWRVTQVGDTLVASDSDFTLSFSDGQINGQAACNSYFADFTQQESALSFGPAGATKMLCGEPDRMTLENAFLNNLEKVRRFEIQMGSLALLDETGAPMIWLKPE